MSGGQSDMRARLCAAVGTSLSARATDRILGRQMRVVLMEEDEAQVTDDIPHITTSSLVQTSSINSGAKTGPLVGYIVGASRLLGSRRSEGIQNGAANTRTLAIPAATDQARGRNSQGAPVEALHPVSSLSIRTSSLPTRSVHSHSMTPTALQSHRSIIHSRERHSGF